MTGFFERVETELLAAGRRRYERRRPFARRGGRLAIALAVLLVVPAGAIGGRELWAPDPPPPDPDLRIPEDEFRRVGPVSRVLHIAEGRGPTGLPWRLTAYSCGDRRPDHVVLGLSTDGRGGTRPCHAMRHDDPVRELAVHETYQAGVGATVVYGVTSARVDTVEVRTGDEAHRVRTRQVGVELLRRAGMAEDWRFYVVQVAGSRPAGARVTALSGDRVVACLPSC